MSSLAGTLGVQLYLIAVVVHKDIFAELHGFVLFDPARLAAWHGSGAVGTDLLELYRTTAHGDRVCQEGIAIPILTVEEGDYTIAIRSDNEPPYLNAAPLIDSKGWVLGTETGELALCGLGYLYRWDPSNRHIRRVGVATGWYRVDLLAGINRRGSRDEEWIYEFVLSSSRIRPDFAADLDLSMNIFADLSRRMRR